ncbi:zinc-binding alcohol dehydrogenase family protein [Arthrobacter zhaoguopingii]|uniref:zinc-binding alcohol dehydrogenase family protein n=1 Tax=Arthrobacter zhaoguopingii TaxID=2681491 RepID=UPI001FE68BC3|nr:zinc-binding alcohol dehydrogenase family protein [Arthrobacter zhaoguopingii]
MKTMKAVGFDAGLPISSPNSLRDLELPVPEATGFDLLVEVRAVSVNPVDTKVRAGSPSLETPRVIGYDAVGTVVAVGPDVTRFAVGDEVYYAGSIGRSGTNAQFHLVRENIVGHKPQSLSDAAAAALPLTAITAWEALFDKLKLARSDSGTLLVIGAAGGVGSLIIQLAKALTDLKVIAVASRPESSEWVQLMGADEVVPRDFTSDVKRLAPNGVDYVFTSFTPANLEAIADVIKPRGQVVSIDQSGGSIDALKSKSITWHWELMFTRPLFEPHDYYQHQLLNEFSGMIDAGRIRSTLTTHIEPINAEGLRRAHELLESSTVTGKVVLSNWPS